MNKDELLELAGMIDALGIMFVTVADKTASVTIAETRDKLLKLYAHWYDTCAD